MPKDVAAYLAAQPPETRKVLKQVRTVIRRALPKAEEVLSYGIPAYRQHDRIVLYFAGWRDHFSLYPVGGELEQLLAKQSAPHEFSHKGTIRFPLAAKVPVRLIATIAKLRLEWTAERTAAKKKKKPKKR